MTTKERVHHLVETLPDDDLQAVERYLDQLQAASGDPARRALLRASVSAPEELSPEDEAAIDDALNDDSDISHPEALWLLKR